MCNFLNLLTEVQEYNFISYDELQDAIENDKSDNHFRTSADFLLNAVTDWPLDNLKEPKDLVLNLKKEIQKPLTYDTLLNYHNTKKKDELNCWRQESVFALLEMFDFERKNNYNKTIELETIIAKITEYYKQNLKSST